MYTCRRNNPHTNRLHCSLSIPIFIVCPAPLIDIPYSCHCNQNQCEFFFVLNKFDLRICNFKFNNSAVEVCAHCLSVVLCSARTRNQNQGGGPFLFFLEFVGSSTLSSLWTYYRAVSSIHRAKVHRHNHIYTNTTHTLTHTLKAWGAVCVCVCTRVNRKSCKGANELPFQICARCRRCRRCHWHTYPHICTHIHTCIYKTVKLFLF